VVDLSDIQEELNNRIAKCIKRETGIDLLNPEVASNLSVEDSAIIQEVGVKCGLSAFRKIAKKKFMKWVKNDYEKIEMDLKDVGNRIIRFSSKVGDPVAVTNQLILLSRIIENLVEDIDEEELLSDPPAVVRLLLLSYLGELKSRVYTNSLRPLLFTIDLAKETIGKDMSWCASMLALTIEEQLFKKKAKEFGIVIKEKENYNSILNKVIEYLDENEIRQSREILLVDSHRNIRNKVLHENWNPAEDEMEDIIAHVLKAAQYFSSKNSDLSDK
jgi:hypothetical protein